MASPKMCEATITFRDCDDKGLVQSDATIKVPADEGPPVYENGSSDSDSATSVISSPLYYTDSEGNPFDECCGDSKDLVKSDELQRFNFKNSVPTLSSLSASRGEGVVSSNTDGQDSSSNSVVQMVDSLDTEWTDEKHSSYLTSMEASFVKKMYDKEYCSLDLCGQAPKEMDACDPDSAQSRLSFPSPFNEFKVLQKGCWQKPTFNRAQPAPPVPAVRSSTWIQHFVAPVPAKEQPIAGNESCTNIEENGVAGLKHLNHTRTVPEKVPDTNRGLHLWHHRLQRNYNGSRSLGGKRNLSNMCARTFHVPVTAITDRNFENKIKVEISQDYKLPKKQRMSVEGGCNSPTDQVVPLFGRVNTEEAGDCNYLSKDQGLCTGGNRRCNGSAESSPADNTMRTFCPKHKQLTGNGTAFTKDDCLDEMLLKSGQDCDQ